MLDRDHLPQIGLDGASKDHGQFIAPNDSPGRAIAWLFADKNRMFWVLQIAGWFGFFFFFHMQSVSTYFAGGSIDSLKFSAASSIIGFLATSFILRPIFQFARRMNPVIMLIIAGAACTLMTVTLAAAKALSIVAIFTQGEEWLIRRNAALGADSFLSGLIPDLPSNLFLLLTWAGFYFGINYYLTLRAETHRALQSARLADQAQLKMLRYQLNPHFLFNTLNAISTLVMENNTDHANAMLLKLSGFLRYSLDKDPLQKTSLAEEMRVLDLYLDIERTRFGDRLVFDKQIDDNVLDAKVPSLILQPAIENAIKYAIAGMEEDGMITIRARRVDGFLQMEVSDNGPNAPGDPSVLLSNAQSGVGLTNMRERITHLYGERGKFNLHKNQPMGLTVCIKIPYETGNGDHEQL